MDYHLPLILGVCWQAATNLYRSSRDNAWKSFDPTADWSKTNHAFKIDMGLFQGSPKQILSRLTWELPQTVFGNLASHASNIGGDVESVDYYDGATVVRHRSEGWGGFTLGSYINGDNSIRADPNNALFQHEYGHYLQSQEAGWVYLPKYAIPSAINGLGTPDNQDGTNQHNAFGVEQDANRRAREHFGEGVWNYKSNPIFDSGYNGVFDRDYSRYRTNTGLIHAQWWEYAASFNLGLGWGLISILNLNKGR